MLSVEVNFEEESGRDAIDPLGEIRISDGHSAITIEMTYLDCWLAALIDAYDQTLVAKQVIVDSGVEPRPIQIDVSSDGLLSISYDDVILTPQPREAFKRELRKVSQSFLEAIVGLPGYSRNTTLDPIKKFVPGV